MAGVFASPAFRRLTAERGDKHEVMLGLLQLRTPKIEPLNHLQVELL